MSTQKIADWFNGMGSAIAAETGKVVEAGKNMVDTYTQKWIDGMTDFLDDIFLDTFLSIGVVLTGVSLLIFLIGALFKRDLFSPICSVIMGALALGLTYYGKGMFWEHLASSTALAPIITLLLFQVVFITKGTSSNTDRRLRDMERKIDQLLERKY